MSTKNRMIIARILVGPRRVWHWPMSMKKTFKRIKIHDQMSYRTFSRNLLMLINAGLLTAHIENKGLSGGVNWVITELNEEKIRWYVAPAVGEIQ